MQELRAVILDNIGSKLAQPGLPDEERISLMAQALSLLLNQGDHYDAFLRHRSLIERVAQVSDHQCGCMTT